MTLIELGALGDLVASLGVIATFIYLALQMRQNTKAIRLSTSHAVTGELQHLYSLMASDQGLSEVIIQAAQKPHLSGATRLRFTTFASNAMRVYENAFLLKHDDSISKAHWEGITRMMIDFTSWPAFSEYWQDRKHWLSDDFQAYMDAEIIPTPPKVGVTNPGNM